MQNTKQKVRLTPLIHRGSTWIGIHFPHLPVLQKAVRKTRQIKWSQSNKCWYLPFTRACYDELLKNIEPFAGIDNSALKQYKKAPIHAPAKPEIYVQALSQHTLTSNIKPAAYINPVNGHILPAMHQTLVLKAYSPSTIRTYLNEMSVFLQALKTTPADEFPVSRIKSYLQYCFEKLKLSENTLHSRINALKFYYEQVLKRERFFWEVPRPKKRFQNPHFFNQDEIARIIKGTTNLKHRTMLMLSYSSGLRVSEVVGMKVWQIDSRRMQLTIQQAKGKKDRIVPLSPVLLVMLREYYTMYRPRKNGYLFEGDNKDEPYSARSFQKVLQQAKERAGILKPGSTHALRHSFATHLLDKGTDISMIMKLLGHNDLKTTLRYLHVTNRDILKLISPLDDLSL
ncbi:MAG: tyrosine-type recombinase/integrase [Agriterribacter sp.]